MTETSSFQQDLERGRWDIAFWAERFLAIRMHPGQLRMAKLVLARAADRWWTPAYYDIRVSAGNRAGKTLGLALIVLHSAFYKAGLRPPETDRDAERWRTTPYLWYHFGPSQLVANKLHFEIELILKGIHPAQRGLGCPLAEMLPHVADTDKKFEGEYRWIVLDPVLGGAEIHFRTASEKATSSLGQDMHGESLDEAGFQPDLLWVYDNVMHLRRLGTGGQIIFISTPEAGHNEFSDLWYMGDPEAPDRQPRTIAMRMSTRENIGFGIDAKTFEDLTSGMDEDFIKQNIDGFFIQGRAAYFNIRTADAAFVDLPEQQPARRQQTYVQGVDPALRHDSTWSLVFHVGPDGSMTGVRAARVRGKQTTDAVVGLAMDGHNAYDVNRDGFRSWCSTALDATGFGGKMFREALEKDIPMVRSIEFGGSIQKKRKLLGDVRTMIDTGKLKMPRSGLWLEVRKQILGYKIDDRAIEQDAVMALACAVAEARRTPAEAEQSVGFDAFGTGARPRPEPFSWRRPRHPGAT